MHIHQLNWHIRKPQYGSRRLAAKNHLVAALGEVSPPRGPLTARSDGDLVLIAL